MTINSYNSGLCVFVPKFPSIKFDVFFENLSQYSNIPTLAMRELFLDAQT